MDQVCAACGYDLSGLPRGAPCPECAGRERSGPRPAWLRLLDRPLIEIPVFLLVVTVGVIGGLAVFALLVAVVLRVLDALWSVVR